MNQYIIKFMVYYVLVLIYISIIIKYNQLTKNDSRLIIWLWSWSIFGVSILCHSWKPLLFCTYWLPSQADFWSRLDYPLLVGNQVDSLWKVTKQFSTFSSKHYLKDFSESSFDSFSGVNYCFSCPVWSVTSHVMSENQFHHRRAI